MQIQKGFAPIAIILIIVGVLALGGGVYIAQKAVKERISPPSEEIQQKPTLPISGKPCIQEAKICPDGISVGRTGPNCEFAECPGEKSKLRGEASGGCVIGGCSSTVCGEEEFINQINTTCEWREEFACFRTVKCERQKDEKCGWTMTEELKTCLSKFK